MGSRSTRHFLARARAEGRVGGGRHSLSLRQQQHAIELLNSGKSQSEVASVFGVHRSTICRLVSERRVLAALIGCMYFYFFASAFTSSGEGMGRKEPFNLGKARQGRGHKERWRTRLQKKASKLPGPMPIGDGNTHENQIFLNFFEKKPKRSLDNTL